MSMTRKLYPELVEQVCASCNNFFKFKWGGKERKYCGLKCSIKEGRKRIKKLESYYWDENLKHEKNNDDQV